MSPEALQAKLRRIFNCSTLEVKIDRRYALEHRHHPQALQVWDRGVVSGEPYIVAVLEDGKPSRPAPVSEAFFATLWRSFCDQQHQGRKSWAEQQALNAEHFQEDQETAADKKLDEQLWSREDEIMRVIGHRKRFAVTAGKRMRRTRAGVLVPA